MDTGPLTVAMYDHMPTCPLTAFGTLGSINVPNEGSSSALAISRGFQGSPRPLQLGSLPHKFIASSWSGVFHHGWHRPLYSTL